MSFIHAILQIIINNKDLIVALSSLGTLIIALIGLNTWKKQLNAKASNKIARNILRDLYVIQNEIALVRTPFRTYNETQIAEQEIEKFNKQLGKNGQFEASLYNIRTQRLRKACSDLYAILPEAEILWGKDVRDIVEPLFILIEELYKNVDGRILHESFPDSDGIEYDPKVVLASSSKDDEFSKEIEGAVQKIKKYIEPRIKILN